MLHVQGQLEEMRLDDQGVVMFWIACPAQAIPAPGRYLLARAQEQVDAPLATPLFPVEIGEDGFLAVPCGPVSWEPGDSLFLRGPLGRGFHLPVGTRRLALVALGERVARLFPLMRAALGWGGEVALFVEEVPSRLPPVVEARPLSAAPDGLAWADFLALDLPLDRVSDLRTILGVDDDISSLKLPAQALVLAGMPCGGLADCGVCGLETRAGWKLVCKDGPVFDLGDLI